MEPIFRTCSPSLLTIAIMTIIYQVISSYLFSPDPHKHAHHYRNDCHNMIQPPCTQDQGGTTTEDPWPLLTLGHRKSAAMSEQLALNTYVRP